MKRKIKYRILLIYDDIEMNLLLQRALTGLKVKLTNFDISIKVDIVESQVDKLENDDY